MGKRIVAAQAISHEGENGGLVEYVRGDEVELSPEREKLADENGSLVPEGSTLAEHDARNEAIYRGQRGDATAAGELAKARAGGIETIADRPGVSDEGDVEQFAAWLRDEEPTVDETVEMAHGDPARAQQLLQAESLATGQQPRAGVEKGLRKIIDGSGE